MFNTIKTCLYCSHQTTIRSNYSYADNKKHAKHVEECRHSEEQYSEFIESQNKNNELGEVIKEQLTDACFNQDQRQDIADAIIAAFDHLDLI